MNRKLKTLALCLLVSGPVACAADVTRLPPEKLAQEGFAAYRRGDFSQAISFLSARAQVSPGDPNALYYLGNCYLHTKQNDQAAKMYSACVRLSPASQAGQCALTALEKLSTLSKETPETAAPDPEAVAAIKDSLYTEKPIDKSFNDAVERIKSQRQTLKTRIDRVWEDMQEDMHSLVPKMTTNYAGELEKLQRDAENKVQDLQTRELRFENRLLAPDKIDARAIPQLPQERPDNTKTALGSLLEYHKSDKTFDPFSSEITPELTSKFMTLRDVFGELSTYTPAARRMAKQVFLQLKRSIESKQDQFDMQLYQFKSNLIRDLIAIRANFPAESFKWQPQASTFITSAKVPRSSQHQLSSGQLEMSQCVERATKRLKELEDGYNRDVDALVAGAKERVSGLVAQTGQMNTQLNRPSGGIQLVPLGSDAYTRNYVNFGDRNRVTGERVSHPTIKPLRAEAKKLPAILRTPSGAEGTKGKTADKSGGERTLPFPAKSVTKSK